MTRDTGDTMEGSSSQAAPSGPLPAESDLHTWSDFEFVDWNAFAEPVTWPLDPGNDLLGLLDGGDGPHLVVDAPPSRHSSSIDLDAAITLQARPNAMAESSSDDGMVVLTPLPSSAMSVLSISTPAADPLGPAILGSPPVGLGLPSGGSSAPSVSENRAAAESSQVVATATVQRTPPTKHPELAQSQGSPSHQGAEIVEVQSSSLSSPSRVSNQTSALDAPAFNCFTMRPILPKSPTKDSSTGSDALQRTSAVLPVLGKRKQNTQAGRKKIKSVRRAGACLRCRIYKESCDENTPCGRCIAVSNTAKVFRQPCYREPLNNVIAFRAGNARAGKIRSEPMVPRWASEDTLVRHVTLFYPFKAAIRASNANLVIQCRKFIPYTWDVLVEPWTISTGDVITLQSSPFTCYDLDTGLTEMTEYLASTKTALLDESLDGVDDQILKLSFAEAIRYSSIYPDSAVSVALSIRAASYFSRTRMVMTGANVLDLPYFGDDRLSVGGGLPIPAVLDYQVDYLAIRHMLDCMKQIVRRLKTLIFSQNVRNGWYEVYLTTFVLLSSLETVHARQIDILRRFESQGGSLLSQVHSTGLTMIKEWEYSAKILIYHYRAILKGMIPFASTWNDEHARDMRQNCRLDEDAISYVRSLAEVIKSRQFELRDACQQDLDNSSAKPLVWISQLYMDDME
ncbi:Zn(2)-C6 fungal-type domain-containing protein [Madurella fahalii]|uniref:Zn(2)-C6 fungal-type domain-containing protein n=1 Tax=Madurella fahalii TaxID=1157608 RepID=A0ABQ0GGZ9_9PEZI